MICPSFIVIENFYENPDEVRKYALKQNYQYRSSSYPGKRSTNYYYPMCIHNTLQTILSPFYSKIKILENSSNGKFQIMNENDKSWIHVDTDNIDKSHETVIAGVCFLTPNAPLDSGTIFYEKKSNDQYIQTDTIHNKYNRLILFNGNIHHISGKYFGSTDCNSRLTQVFFLNCS